MGADLHDDADVAINDVAVNNAAVNDEGGSSNVSNGSEDTLVGVAKKNKKNGHYLENNTALSTSTTTTADANANNNANDAMIDVLPGVSKELTQDKVKWLQEQAFQKKSQKEGEEKKEILISNELTQDKVKWLQEQAFQKSSSSNDHEQGLDNVVISNELTQDKVKWLQEQAFQKSSSSNDHEQDLDNVVISNELTQDKVKWLQEQAFPKLKNDHLFHNETIDNNAGHQSPPPPQDRNNIQEERIAFGAENKEVEEVEEKSEHRKETIDCHEKEDNGNNKDLYALLNASKARLAATQEKYLSSKDEDEDDDSCFDDDDDDDDDNTNTHSKSSHNGILQKSNDRHDHFHIPTEVGISHDEVCIEESLTLEDGANNNSSNSNINSNHNYNHKEIKGETITVDGNDSDNNNISGLLDDVDDSGGGSDDGIAAISTIEKKLSPPAMTKNEIGRQQKQNDNKELWALLNYSKVRLATGSTPTASEAKTLGISGDNALTPTDSKEDRGIGNEEYHNDDDGEDDGSLDEEDSISIDLTEDGRIRISNENGIGSFNDRDLSFDESNHDIFITPSKSIHTERNENNDARRNDNENDFRARALAALAMASSRDIGSGNKCSDEGSLSEKQLLQSILLAEEASQSGVTEFATKDKMSFLDSINIGTPRRDDGRDSALPKTEKTKFWNGIMKKKNQNIGVEQHRNVLGERTRNFFALTKVKAEKAMNDIKGNIAKAEDHPRHHQKPSTAPLSPLQDLKERIAKVDQMYAEKYKDPAAGPYV